MVEITFLMKFSTRITEENIRNLHVDKIHLSNGKEKKIKINHDLFASINVDIGGRLPKGGTISVGIKDLDENAFKKYISEMICGNSTVDLFLLKYPKFDVDGKIIGIDFRINLDKIHLSSGYENREFIFHN